MNYQDIKTKTLNWCNKMHNVGLLDSDQYNQCIATFADASNGLIPSEINNNLQTGIERNYSLYNAKIKEMTPNISGTNSLSVLLTTVDGLTLGCKPDNTVYFIPNMNDSNINQNELNLTLVPQSGDVYSILSPNGKFLMANDNYGVAFNGTAIGPTSLWKLVKINAEDAGISGITKIMINSVQYPDFYLIYDDTMENIKLVYGSNEFAIWTMTSKEETATADGVTNIGAEYFVNKENILKKYRESAINKEQIKISIETLRTLSSIINNKFMDVRNHIVDRLNNEKKLYDLSRQDYETRVSSLNENSMLSNEAKNQIASNLPPIQGMNITSDTISNVENNIMREKNNLLQSLQNVITQLESQVNQIDMNTSKDEYNSYLADIRQENEKITNRIKQNNVIIMRQKDKNNKLSSNIAQNNTKIDKLKQLDEVSHVNMSILSNVNDQKYYIMKIYPVIILLLILFLFYLIYITYNKFIANIYMKY